MKTKIGIVCAILFSLTVIPLATSQRGSWAAKGGGWFYEDSAKNNFGMYVAGTTPPYDFWVDYHDREDDYHFYGYIITEFSVDITAEGWHVARTKGRGFYNGILYAFGVNATDKGGRGRGLDEFHIRIADVSTFPYTTIDDSWGVLGGGNINIRMTK